jgi:tRNA(Arg) A34 adenosine deaminase TadA
MSGSTLDRRRFLHLVAAGGAVLAAPPLMGASRVLPRDVGVLTSAEQAAQRVLAQATDSVSLGSKGVGGLIMDNRSGRVIREGRNHRYLPVNPEVANGPGEVFTWDYTAHGETALVGWYQANRRSMKLPDPKHLTVVTSLDPCAMCTGSILTAGLNAAVVAYDPTGGMNVTEDGRYRSLTPRLRNQAFDSIGFYGVTAVRDYFGPTQIPLRSTEVSAATADACRAIFFGKNSAVRRDKDVARDQLINPASLSADDPFRIAMRTAWPDALTLRMAAPTKPSRELKVYLEGVRDATPGATNAVAFIDLFGNLITAKADNPRRGPIATAFMNTTQSYARTRYRLFNDPVTHEGARMSLAEPSSGAFIWLHAPTPDIASTLKDLGAFGSTMSDPAPGGFQFFDGPLKGTYGDLLEQVALLPPYYTQLVDVSPLPVGVFSPLP